MREIRIVELAPSMATSHGCPIALGLGDHLSYVTGTHQVIHNQSRIGGADQPIGRRLGERFAGSRGGPGALTQSSLVFETCISRCSVIRSNIVSWTITLISSVYARQSVGNPGLRGLTR